MPRRLSVVKEKQWSTHEQRRSCLVRGISINRSFTNLLGLQMTRKKPLKAYRYWRGNQFSKLNSLLLAMKHGMPRT
jgi:hypothetical protein